jgi:hypothetical protein
VLEQTSGWENKTVVRCKQCGTPFVRYVYEKLARCEECRKANRMAALTIVDKGHIRSGA